jgi:hypothetical protein
LGVALAGAAGLGLAFGQAQGVEEACAKAGVNLGSAVVDYAGSSVDAKGHEVVPLGVGDVLVVFHVFHNLVLERGDLVVHHGDCQDACQHCSDANADAGSGYCLD